MGMRVHSKEFGSMTMTLLIAGPIVYLANLKVLNFRELPLTDTITVEDDPLWLTACPPVELYQKRLHH